VAKCVRTCDTCVPLDLVFDSHQSRALAIAACFHFLFVQALVILRGHGLFCRESVVHLRLDLFQFQEAAWLAIAVQLCTNSLWVYP